MSTVIDGRDRFGSIQKEYKVTISVKISSRFILAVVLCILLRKDLRITHTFDNNPFMRGTDADQT